MTDESNVNSVWDLPARKLPSHFAGQPIFVQGADWQNNAMLVWTHFPWDTYAAGYKDAADALVNALLERKAPLDTVIYPLVFCIVRRSSSLSTRRDADRCRAH